MYSSLPSASKIYVSSCKSKHKTLNSAKKKRKKSPAITSTPVRVYDEDTLISSISLRKGAASQLSMNSNEESVDNEIHSEIKEETLSVSEEVIYEENTACEEKKCIENKSIDIQNETNESIIYKDDIKINNEASQADKADVEPEKISTVIPDDDKSYKTDIFETDLAHESSDVESSESMVKTVVPKSSSHKTHESTSCSAINSTENDENFTSSLTTADTGVQTYEDNTVSNDEWPVTVSISDMNEKIDDCKLLKSSAIHSNLTDVVSSDTSLKCEVSSILPENSYMFDDKDVSDEKIPSDSDSSSVRSDCCAATNIYDIHIDNSEHGSLEESQNSNHQTDRIQSPEQSEVSCTESIMCDAKSIYQNESSFHSSSENHLYKNHVSSKSIHMNATDMSNLPKKGDSHSFMNLQKAKSRKVLLRSLSVPEKICNCRNSELVSGEVTEKNLDNSMNNLNNYGTHKLPKFSSTSDKSTLTTEVPVVTSEKSTITLNVSDTCHSKKDAATTPIKSTSKLSMVGEQHPSTSLKDSTMLLMKVLPPVTVMQARAR